MGKIKGPPGRCKCGERFEGFTPYERHARALPGGDHAHFELELFTPDDFEGYPLPIDGRWGSVLERAS